MLRSCLDCGNRALAAQDVRHADQCEAEPVAGFIRCLKCTFRTAYGQDHMSLESKGMLLYWQLQEGMQLQLMMAPAVSGAKSYQESIIAAKNEKKRLADLNKKQEYTCSIPQSSCPVQKPRTSRELHEASKPKHFHDRNAHQNQERYVEPLKSSFECYITYIKITLPFSYQEVRYYFLLKDRAGLKWPPIHKV